MDLNAVMDLFRQGTEEQMASFLETINRGMALWSERTGKPAKKVAAPRKRAATKKEAAPLPDAGEDGAPDASAYRIAPSEIDETLCQARRIVNEDKRWKPAVFGEGQCDKKPVDGSDLCKTCTARLERYADDPKPGVWLGRITEEPLSWTHMLGTEWAETKAPKWMGVITSGTASKASSVKEEETETGETEEAAEAGAGTKEAEKAAKKAEAEAKKAAEKAAKEVEKAAKKAEAEAKKAAEKAAKEEAKKAKEAGKKAAAPKKAAAAAAPAEVPAKADTAAETAEVEGELKLIDGNMYMVKNGNVYEYNDMDEKAGDFVGRLGADGESIDTDAEEEE
jgi:chemotaxis protein histidine kinase CheA